MHSFTLTDRQGEEHLYEVTLHTATEGHKLAWAIQALGTRTLVVALKAAFTTPEAQRVFGAMQGQAEGTEDPEALVSDMFGAMGSALGGMDVDSVGEALSELLSNPKVPDLARDVLKHTLRDGRPLKGAEWQCYQGNYGEMMQAVVQVVLANDFFPVASLFSRPSSPKPEGAQVPNPSRKRSTRKR